MGKGNKGKGMAVPEGNIMQQLLRIEWDSLGRRIRKTEVRGPNWPERGVTPDFDAFGARYGSGA
jgi:hypothetical protein